MVRHRNYVVQRKSDGKYWDFKDCTWVEEVNDFCKITGYMASSFLKLEEVIKEIEEK